MAYDRNRGVTRRLDRTKPRSKGGQQRAETSETRSGGYTPPERAPEPLDVGAPQPREVSDRVWGGAVLLLALLLVLLSATAAALAASL